MTEPSGHDKRFSLRRQLDGLLPRDERGHGPREVLHYASPATDGASHSNGTGNSRETRGSRYFSATNRIKLLVGRQKSFDVHFMVEAKRSSFRAPQLCYSRAPRLD